MATYAKILKNTDGDQILPYTRSKLVYMDDGSTVEEAVTRPATNAQLGRVIIGNGLGYDGKGTISLGKVGITSTLGYVPVSPNDYGSKNAHGVLQVGSNINVDSDGIISVNDSNIKEALGYTPTNKSYTISSFSKDEMTYWNSDNNYTYKNGVTIYHAGGGDKYISKCNNHVYTGDNFALIQFYITTSQDLVANSSAISLRVRWENRIVDTNFGRIIAPIYMLGSNIYEMQIIGSMMLTGGYENELYPILLATATVPSGYSIYSNFIYPLK